MATQPGDGAGDGPRRGPGAGDGAKTSGQLREHNRVRLLRAVHDLGAEHTRSRLTRELGLARATASVLVAELIADELLDETPAVAAHTRGRPTQVPGPHPHGPVALAADLREDGWELAVCALGGRTETVADRAHDGSPGDALRPLGTALTEQLGKLGERVVGIGLSVAGPVREGGLVDIAHLGWREVDVAGLLALDTPATAPPLPPLSPLQPPPLHIGNDARLAGLAEARRGRQHGVRVGLHLHVDFDPGGTLLVAGQPLAGASRTAGEFGHMPLTGGREPCQCGATGCWSLDVGRNALLRRMGLTAGAGRGRDTTGHILARAAEGDGEALAAVTENARALGTGIGALINALDPEVVTLSGMGVELHALAQGTLTESAAAGLMAFRRGHPPLVAPSSLVHRGPLIGAMESVFDAFLTPEGVAAWREPRRRGAPSDSP